MRRIYVFLGPSLDVESARGVLDAEFLPPAAMGDVYRASLEGPFAIGVVDGFFERVPALWHKEILWALSRPIHVFGASSMGALRAAELHRFGMRGIGRVFEAFRAGVLEDDDEVAIAHGDGDARYRPCSEALVNIRATLERAEKQRVIDGALRVHLERLAKETFYSERTYPHLLHKARAELGPLPELSALRDFVVSNRVDLKREDALEMLRAMRVCRDAGEPPPAPRFEVANSEPWTQLRAWAHGRPRLGTVDDREPPSRIAAEARRTGGRGRALLAEAYARALAAALGSADWRERFVRELDEYVVEAAREAGLYDQLARRSREKRRVLDSQGLDEPTLEDTGLPRTYLLDWYLSAIGSELELGRALTRDGLLKLGFVDEATLAAEAAKEFLYARMVGEAAVGW